ncbi:putative membrane protein [Streptomyces himastatinicus ATCC 53653]|uniref:Putative membrane protein n=1 Tax=Streptomyces himastatinicus ATCC 53653 TaxID=457427 RepID=D9WHQ9_9ACTN|nr:putative membrane protein [Streptomyces himastatinicus ATCC 53653]
MSSPEEPRPVCGVRPAQEVLDVKPIHLLGAIPFLGILGGIFFVNRVTPYVLGMPFILFWLVLWVVLISATMAVIYRLDPANREEDAA